MARVTKSESGKWIADIQPGGRGGKRYRKRFATRKEAERWLSWILQNKTEDTAWEPKRPDSRRLSELIELWHQTHGHSLRSDQHKRLLFLCERLGDPYARHLDKEMFVKYRRKRMDVDGVSANTANREHSYLRAMFLELERQGLWSGGNPLDGIRQLRVSENALRFLDREEVQRLLDALGKASSNDALLVSLVCLATGARWSEAQNLLRQHVSDSAVTFTDTKNRRNRTVPISPELSARITLGRGEKLFGNCLSTFKRAVKVAEISLPRGQLTHVLRHTFASHYLARGGQIRALQEILGHSSLNVTMRYAHCSPRHMEDAVRLNPLAGVDIP